MTGDPIDPDPDPGPGPLDVVALARHILAGHRRAARQRRKAEWDAPGPRTGAARPRPGRRWDPQALGSTLDAFAEQNGWVTEIAVWALTRDWPRLVGENIAEHVRVIAFRPQDPRADEEEAPQPEPGAQQQALLVDPGRDTPRSGADVTGGLLVLQADSEAWVTHVRYLLPDLHRMLERELGRGVVGRIEVHGPDRPGVPGRRRVSRPKRS